MALSAYSKHRRHTIYAIPRAGKTPCARSFLTCHRRSKFHSSCASLALISCETPPLPLWVHRRRCRSSGYVFHLNHDLRAPPASQRHTVIATDSRPTFRPTYVDNYCCVYVFTLTVPCQIRSRFSSLKVSSYVQSQKLICAEYLNYSLKYFKKHYFYHKNRLYKYNIIFLFRKSKNFFFSEHRITLVGLDLLIEIYESLPMTSRRSTSGNERLCRRCL